MAWRPEDWGEVRLCDLVVLEEGEAGPSDAGESLLLDDSVLAAGLAMAVHDNMNARAEDYGIAMQPFLPLSPASLLMIASMKLLLRQIPGLRLPLSKAFK